MTFRMVGSMTTLPDRIPNIIEPIKHILNQTHPLDILYLHIPDRTLRGKKYVLPDNFLRNFDGYPTQIVINYCGKDYGPITKLAPVLDIEKDPNTYIVTFDDDIIADKNLVKILYEKILQYPNTCLGFSGVCIGEFPFYFQFAITNKIDHHVDWIQGVHVVAYKRGFFGDINDLVTFGDDTPVKDVLLFNDDHRISAYLASKNIPRISIGCDIHKLVFRFGNLQDDALSGNILKLAKQHYNIVKHYRDAGLYHHTYNIANSFIFMTFASVFVGIIVMLVLVPRYGVFGILFGILAIFILTKILRRNNGILKFGD